MSSAHTFHRELAERAAELLSDGQWHSYEQVMRELVKLVPPGPAKRRNEKDRIGSSAKGGVTAPPVRARPRDVQDLIRSGARSIVREFLGNKKVYETNRSGLSGAAGADPERQIRLIGKSRLLAVSLPKGVGAAEAYARLVAERDRFQREADLLRGWLIKIGHAAAADRIAPRSEGDHERG